MKKILLALLTFAVFNTYSYSQKYEIIQKKDKYGIAEGKKTWVKPQYQKISALDNNFFYAKKDGKCGVISPRGMVMIPMAYEDVKHFDDGLYIVRDQNLWGIVDRMNQLVLPIGYTNFEFLDDYLCEVKSQGKSGLINKFGKVLIPAVYDDIAAFSPYLLMIKKDGKSGLVDMKGNLVVPALYDEFDIMAERNMYCVKSAGKIGLMDYSGRMILDAVYDNIEYDSPVGYLLHQDGKIGFYIAEGKVIAPVYSKILFAQPEFGLVVVKEGDKYALITSRGVVTAAAYENISRFSPQGIAFVEKSGKLMAVNYEGREMLLQEVMGGGNRPPQ